MGKHLKYLKRRIRLKISRSLLDQLIDSLKSDQTLDDRVEELLMKGLKCDASPKDVKT